MSSPVPPGQPDQGLHDQSPDQGLHDVPPDQKLDTTSTTKSKTPLFVGIGAAVVVVIGIIAAIFH